MDKVLNMTYTSSLTNLCEVNSSFDTGVLRICYTGVNRNKSSISREAIERSLSTIYNCPIVCNYDRDTDTLGGHDMELVQDADGGLHIINSTTPVGVIPESSKTWFEDYEEDDGTVHTYLCADVLLWKRQEAYKKIKKDGITAHSMEITVKSGKSVDGIYRVDDFEFTAFALIGTRPCFEGSALEMFSQNDFRQQLSEMMCDLKETFSKVNSSEEDNNIHPQNFSMEGGRKVLEDKMALVAKYNIDIETLDFSIEDLSVEELTEKFEAIKAENDKKQSMGKFALVSNIIEEIHRALEVEKLVDEWGERCHYVFVDCDMEAGEVYCWDVCDWLLYGFAFSVDGDAVSVDFSSKKRKKFVIADFEGGEQPSPIAPVFELFEEKMKGYADIEAKFNIASDTIKSMNTELDELRQFRADAENAIAEGEREKVFAQFEDLNGIEAFEALRENCMNFDLDSLEERCFAIRGRNSSVMKFSAKSNTPKLKVEKTEISNDEPYGGLFIKYAKTGSN